MMELNVQTFKYMSAIFFGALASAFGEYDAVFKLFILLVIFDFGLGLLKSVKAKEFSSSVARWGFVNKLVEFVVIAVCFRIDVVIQSHNILRNIAIVWFCICEGASILENCAYMGLPIPDGIVDVLIQAKKGISINITDIAKKLLTELTDDSRKE